MGRCPRSFNIYPVSKPRRRLFLRNDTLAFVTVSQPARAFHVSSRIQKGAGLFDSLEIFGMFICFHYPAAEVLLSTDVNK
jgi:hypothetical protein